MLSKMSTFQQQYKGKKFGFSNIDEARYIRAGKYEESRRKQRAKVFNENRNISNSVASISQKKEEQPAPVVENRMTRLLKWKAERDRRRKVEQIKKKPPFVVGVVHHKIYSPINKDETIVPTMSGEKIHNQLAPIPPIPPRKGITRATEKRLLKKTFTKGTVKGSIKNPKPIDKEQKSQKKQEQSFAPVDYKFKPPAGLPKMQLFGRVAIQSMSPAKMGTFVSSSSRMSKANRKSGTTEFIVERINNEKNDTSTIDTKIVQDDSEDSIEAVTLKLSSDEEEISNFCNNNSDSNSNTKVTDEEVCDNSVTGMSSPKNNKSISTPSDSLNEPAFYSPYIVSSREKSNARKEQQLKRGFSLSGSQSDDIPTKDTVMKTLNVSSEEEERTAQYFQFLLNREVDRLNELCNKWTAIKEDSTTTEDGQYEINQAIGQTNLLITKKFERFRGLVADCETGRGEMLVTCKDLQGFWDMMYMEVTDCDLRFEKLEKLRVRGWKEEQSPPTKSKPVTRKKIIPRKKAVCTKGSSVKAFLAEKKKKMTQQTSSNGSTEEFQWIDNQVSDKEHENNEKKCTPIKNRKTRKSLLQKVQLSETSKNLKSPLTIMKVSQMCKTPVVQLNDTIPYVNSDQTPGKSILKQPKNSVEVESCVKSINKVNFDDRIILNEVPVDEKTQVKMDLAATLSRIDSFDFDSPDEVTINAGKKLTFDDNSFEEVEDNINQSSKLKNFTNLNLPSIQIQCASPLQNFDSSTRSNVSSKRRSLRRQNAVDVSDERLDETLTLSVASTPLTEITDEVDVNIFKQRTLKEESLDKTEEIDAHNGSIRVLRNRTIISGDTPKHKRLSRNVSINIGELEHKENNTPLITRRRKSSFKLNSEDKEKMNVQNSMDMSMNIQESEHKENKTPSTKVRKSSLKVSTEDKKKMDLQDSIGKMSLDEKSDKRRSTRSVKFSEKECSGCQSKPTLSMTPHIRRSKTQSNEKKRRSTLNEEGSWETPEKPPERVRRSQNKK